MSRFGKTTICTLLSAFLALTATDAAQQTKSAPAAKSNPTTPAPKQNKSGIPATPYVGAIVIEPVSGQVLFEQNADAKAYPASVLKLMDLLILLERIKVGQLALQDPVPVSAKSSNTGGSQVYLAHKEVFPLEDMLYALMVQSANDAAVALAEKVGGSTEAFVELMNAKAQALGMRNTRFSSVHGLPPAPGQGDDITTARDLSILCRELLRHPETLKYTSARARTFRGNDPKKKVDMRTHNHLLGSLSGCDGLKTGYITKAGFSIAVTASRNGQRVVVVVLGSADRKVRDQKAAELAEKGFAALAAKTAAQPVPAKKS
jgi:D-alanyl-D-alanine carboxypeptidase (penicillin-binding protein 5/6)